MQQHDSKCFARRHTLDPGGGVKTFFFLKVVLLHIKCKGNGAKSTTQAHILSLHTHLTLEVGSEGQNNCVFFSESSHVVYQTKWE